MKELDQVKRQKHITSTRNGRWTFFSQMSFSKCVCLMCSSTIAVPKKGNVERHFRTVHGRYDTDFPPKSELRKRKVNELKSQLTGQQSFFTQHTSKAKAATEASFRVCHTIVKNKKSFQDGEMVKEAFVEAADSLFRDLKKIRQRYYLQSKLCSCQDIQLHVAVMPWPRI